MSVPSELIGLVLGDGLAEGAEGALDLEEDDQSFRDTPVSGPNVAGVAYAARTRTLSVSFHSGPTYTYDHVSPDDARAMLYGDPGLVLWPLIIPKYGRGSR
ncbi:MAG TPA: KTSC domain-containing protein [Nevskiaceae bacterium]|nr:KTSC domain-containing protein [Nevskiaceae bacterium]